MDRIALSPGVYYMEVGRDEFLPKHPGEIRCGIEKFTKTIYPVENLEEGYTHAPNFIVEVNEEGYLVSVCEQFTYQGIDQDNFFFEEMDIESFRKRYKLLNPVEGREHEPYIQEVFENGGC